jgi:imidazolonepropionase-like amidohydrolase
MLALALPAVATDVPSKVTLFRNVSILDGESEKLRVGHDVLVVADEIKEIGENIRVADTYEIDVKTGGLKEVAGPSAHDWQGPGNKVVVVYEPEKMVKTEVKVSIIDAKGRTLMPGLIDAHWHMMFNFWPISKMMGADFGSHSIAAALSAKDALLRGFTTVRDPAGNCMPVKNAIDEGLIDGPRVYPSLGAVSQTSGHFDFRGPNDVPEDPNALLPYTMKVGHTIIADGVPEVIKRTREVLRMGATQVKAMAGGGVSSLFDPLDVTEYTFEEAKAICDVARTWNTYVTIHANTDEAIQMWIRAGAMCVEHGLFISEETAKLMAEKGVWWSMQAMEVEGEDAYTFESPISQAKYVDCVAGLEKVIAQAQKHHVKTAWGTDILFDPAFAKKQGKFLAKLERWYTPYEVLRMATSGNAELLKMCGPRDPSPGEFGVVKEGAFADLILVNGNPLENIDLVADPDRNSAMIMKGGVVYKNTLS